MQTAVALVSVVKEDWAHVVNYPDGFPLREVGAQYTPCSWTLVPDSPQVLVVEDTLQDAR